MLLHLVGLVPLAAAEFALCRGGKEGMDARFSEDVCLVRECVNGFVQLDSAGTAAESPEWCRECEEGLDAHVWHLGEGACVRVTCDARGTKVYAAAEASSCEGQWQCGSETAHSCREGCSHESLDSVFANAADGPCCRCLDLCNPDDFEKEYVPVFAPNDVTRKRGGPSPVATCTKRYCNWETRAVEEAEADPWSCCQLRGEAECDAHCGERGVAEWNGVNAGWACCRCNCPHATRDACEAECGGVVASFDASADEHECCRCGCRCDAPGAACGPDVTASVVEKGYHSGEWSLDTGRCRVTHCGHGGNWTTSDFDGDDKEAPCATTEGPGEGLVKLYPERVLQADARPTLMVTWTNGTDDCAGRVSLMRSVVGEGVIGACRDASDDEDCSTVACECLQVAARCQDDASALLAVPGVTGIAAIDETSGARPPAAAVAAVAAAAAALLLHQ